jgi:hypothetical protein
LLNAPLTLSSILSSLEGTDATAVFAFSLLLITIVNLTADVVLEGVLNSPPS